MRNDGRGEGNKRRNEKGRCVETDRDRWLNMDEERKEDRNCIECERGEEGKVEQKRKR